MSDWISHVKKVAKEKGIAYKDALKVAGKTYKKKDMKKDMKKKDMKDDKKKMKK